MSGEKDVRRTGFFVVALLLASHCALCGADQKTELNLLRDRIETLQRDLAKSEESRGEVADALRTSEKVISEVNHGLLVLGREQGKISQSLADLKKKIDAGRADATRQQALLDRTIRHQYMYGSTDALRLMLDGRDVSEVERQVHYFGYLSNARASMIAGLKQSLAELAVLEVSARNKRDELTMNADAQKKARALLQGERMARQKVFTKIKADITKNRREIGRLKRDEDRLTKLIEQLAKALAKDREDRRERRADRIQQKGPTVEVEADDSFVGRAFQTLRGKLKLPARGELKGRFGSPREDGGVTWKGLFIRAEAGQSVKAVADGRVVYADWLRGFGNLLIVDHGGGYMSLYGNNESLLKQIGERAQSGETVASVGSTGGALESGVYFELRYEGKAFDPMTWVAR
ncbi:MAG: peptidoglycan DD-metalloendopeptidase family protein [Burkholderiales bacterium]|nr:peptidoglycan DD-metalloendopeptidase family protein [Burkholderiales bacterium]